MSAESEGRAQPIDFIGEIEVYIVSPGGDRLLMASGENLEGRRENLEIQLNPEKLNLREFILEGDNVGLDVQVKGQTPRESVNIKGTAAFEVELYIEL